jgi:hypothetical protein
MNVRSCEVSYKDHRGIRHVAEVQAESLYEAACMAIKVFREDPWLERIGPSTVLDVEVREPGTKHSISLQQVERWLASPTPSPSDVTRKARLRMMLVTGK